MLPKHCSKGTSRTSSSAWLCCLGRLGQIRGVWFRQKVEGLSQSQKVEKWKCFILNFEKSKSPFFNFPKHRICQIKCVLLWGNEDRISLPFTLGSIEQFKSYVFSTTCVSGNQHLISLLFYPEASNMCCSLIFHVWDKHRIALLPETSGIENTCSSP